MSNLLQVLQGQTPARRPIWFMRQAGRILPEYRKLKEKYDFASLMNNPELAAEVTMMPLRRFEEIDAAILFTDLLVPIEAMGVPLSYAPDPRLAWTVGSKKDLDRLELIDPEDKLRIPLQTARAVRAQLADSKALLGFVGAPFTLGAYLAEGKGSKVWTKIRAMAYGDPDLFTAVMDKLADSALEYGIALAIAGCDAIQVFDSWAGVAEPDMFNALVSPALIKLVSGLRARKIPVIYYVNGAAPHLATMLATGADCMGLDWRIQMEQAVKLLPDSMPVQGNLDPLALFGSKESIQETTSKIIRAVGDRPHIFNLGHGFEPTTPLESVGHVIERVRAMDAVGETL